MLDWYTDLVDEGKGRWFVNVIVSLLLIGLLLLFGLLPASTYGDIVDGNRIGELLLEEMQFWFFIPILTIVGSGALFLGFDIMRDECGFLGFIRIVVIIFGASMVLFPSIINAMSCGDVSIDYFSGIVEDAGVISSVFRAVPRIGFFGGVFCGAFYAFVGLTDSYDFPHYLSPLMPIIAYLVSFAINIGCSNVVLA